MVALGLGRWEVADHLLDGHWVHIGEPAWNHARRMSEDFLYEATTFSRGRKPLGKRVGYLAQASTSPCIPPPPDTPLLAKS